MEWTTENRLHREQWVPAELRDVFSFFSAAQNLDRITPPWLEFKTLGDPGAMSTGTLIHYRLAWHGLPLRWTSRIEEWRPPERFVDLQLKGPYRLWHHTHTFEEKDGGTLIGDTVRYAVPMGVLGQWAAGWMVRRDVERIFDYREEQVRRIFDGKTL